MHLPSRDWESVSGDVRRFLLLDGAQCHQIGAVISQIPFSEQAIHLFDGVLASGTEDASVYLGQLSPETDLHVVLDRIQAGFKSHGAISVIESSLTQTELSQRLMRRLDAMFPNGKEFLVRFFDGRVFPFLVDVMGVEQRDVFLAVGHQWWFISPELEWRFIGLGNPESDPYHGPLQLTDSQRRRLLDDTYPYTIIDHFAFADEELLDQVPASDRYRFFKKCIGVARSFGIHDGQRTVMICTWALLSNEDYFKEPVWQKRLEDLAAGRRTTRDIGNEVWPIVESWE